jgi:hypothetical protein
VFKQRVGAENGVVWLNHGSAHLRARVYGEAKLALLAVIDAQALEEQAAKARASATANSVEDKEALKAGAVVSQLADAVEAEIDDFLADGIMATGEVVCSVLFAANKLLGMKQLAVCTRTDFIDHSRLEVKEDTAGHVLASTSLIKEGVERIIAATDGFVGGHLPVGLDAVLKAIQLPAGVASLDASLFSTEKS